MSICAISVCVNYSDFFAWSALANKGLFSKWIIVTDTKDFKTKKIAEAYGYQVVQTDIFYEDGTFKKFKGINVGLEKAGKDWILFLDCDIVLPNITKRVFDSLSLDKECIYGIDRINLMGIQQWINYCNNPDLIHENWLVDLSSKVVGARICQYYGQRGENGKFDGWNPLGFFQLAHKSQFTSYPDSCTGADHCDLVFSKQWKREKRILIPEIVGIHLESENAQWGQNWSGRSTQPFNYVFSQSDTLSNLNIKTNKFENGKY